MSLETILRDRFTPLKKPTLYNLMFGHLQENAVLPIAAKATLDATTKTLTILKSVVVLDALILGLFRKTEWPDSVLSNTEDFNIKFKN